MLLILEVKVILFLYVLTCFHDLSLSLLLGQGGKTAMKWAKQKGHSEVIALLKA